MPHRHATRKTIDKAMIYKIGLHGKPYFLDEIGEWRLSRKPLQEVKVIIAQQERKRSKRNAKIN